MKPTKILYNQRGALFGLDARIALGIFAVLSLVAGAYTAMNMSSIYASSFSKELEETGKAIVNLHQDLEKDVHTVLIDNTDKHAFMALYDKTVLDPELQPLWNGPYVKTTTTVHPRYGETRIIKRTENVDKDCYPEAICYLWLSYDNVTPKVAEQLNLTFDGAEDLAEGEGGRIQWREGYSDNQVILYYRATQTLSGVGYY